MLFRKPGPATKPKKIVYLCASIILGFLLGLIISTQIEIYYLNQLTTQGKMPSFNGSSLPPFVSISIWILGAIAGFSVGKLWWRKIYIERVWIKNRFKK